MIFFELNCNILFKSSIFKIFNKEIFFKRSKFEIQDKDILLKLNEMIVVGNLILVIYSVNIYCMYKYNYMMR